MLEENNSNFPLKPNLSEKYPTNGVITAAIR